MWAVGADHQIYVYVYGLEVPIRVKEVSYENERWNPLSGFGDSLLPTDRPHFSDITGTQEREKEEVTVPGLAWAWDDDWHIETLLNGRQLEMGGWTYAVDFPAEYQPKKSFTSCVRRRKWIRHRRYLATNSWSSVPGCSTAEGEEEEPFIDISVGGEELVGVREGELQVWSVTSSGPAEGALSGFMSRRSSASVGAFAGRGEGRITGGRMGMPWGGPGGGAWFCIYCC